MQGGCALQLCKQVRVSQVRIPRPAKRGWVCRRACVPTAADAYNLVFRVDAFRLADWHTESSAARGARALPGTYSSTYCVRYIGIWTIA